jgi:hypothetical protein
MSDYDPSNVFGDASNQYNDISRPLISTVNLA